MIFNNIIPHPKGNLQKFIRCSSNPCFFFSGVSISKFQKTPYKNHQKSQQLRATPQPSHIFRACSTSSAFLAALAMSFAAVTASTSWPWSWGTAMTLGNLHSFIISDYITIYLYTHSVLSQMFLYVSSLCANMS